ncbi:PREDICTED: thrombin inhibitor rhodniin-like [Ceratosolen solmsi marchali]|uniref:Thrombin inhibitor rhodniin-like n=1 Tax=Ceratosolen solmsi marchali TaxID=326594 RepID=A0AAJ6YJY1_9HYME|nr:PREDICTED: thrombin inhibitor rhodniin-like [Ceratosolen solmsi marchali]
MRYIVVVSVALACLFSVVSAKPPLPTKPQINVDPAKLTLPLTSATRSPESLSLKVSLQAKSDDPNACRCFVPAVYSPVCGSDNKVYANKYLLECENTCSKKKLHVRHNGKC